MLELLILFGVAVTGLKFGQGGLQAFGGAADSPEDADTETDSHSTSKSFTESGYDESRQVRWEKLTRYDINND